MVQSGPRITGDAMVKTEFAGQGQSQAGEGVFEEPGCCCVSWFDFFQLQRNNCLDLKGCAQGQGHDLYRAPGRKGFAEILGIDGVNPLEIGEVG